MREEEESMTGYTPADLAEGWEFKILRSATGSFRNPANLSQAIEQEARAGWVLLEKFDNQRVRLKRPASARAGDGGLDFDPYRTTYGIGPVWFVVFLLGAIFGTLGLVALVAFLTKPHP
jgi:hypothetical protein